MGPVANQAKQGGANRKIAKRLAIRLSDYSKTVASGKKPEGSYHRPGSMQK